jgi:hypothetical protein
MSAPLGLPAEIALTPDQAAYTIHFAATFPDGGCPTEITLVPQYTKPKTAEAPSNGTQ